ncbi:MAG: uncharacterized protein KVP18_000441 [Porospora cf. gigantea A]|uniref:uncharacterized protein n=1 Tax=Porospora cf. gigantea A TaxID=2853593 RepID=UPI0035598E12|nr:MAG: hypothetical protein KVP18_000441 [Porospora cf. gigantea A]
MRVANCSQDMSLAPTVMSLGVISPSANLERQASSLSLTPTQVSVPRGNLLQTLGTPVVFLALIGLAASVDSEGNLDMERLRQMVATAFGPHMCEIDAIFRRCVEGGMTGCTNVLCNLTASLNAKRCMVDIGSSENLSNFRFSLDNAMRGMFFTASGPSAGLANGSTLRVDGGGQRLTCDGTTCHVSALVPDNPYGNMSDCEWPEKPTTLEYDQQTNATELTTLPDVTTDWTTAVTTLMGTTAAVGASENLLKDYSSIWILIGVGCLIGLFWLGYWVRARRKRSSGTTFRGVRTSQPQISVQAVTTAPGTFPTG